MRKKRTASTRVAQVPDLTITPLHAAEVTLDAGALIALQKHSSKMKAILAELIDADANTHEPSVVVAQAWLGNSPPMARLFGHCNLQAFSPSQARKVGQMLASSRTSDIVDADRHDIERLAAMSAHSADLKIVVV